MTFYMKPSCSCLPSRCLCNFFFAFSIFMILLWETAVDMIKLMIIIFDINNTRKNKLTVTSGNYHLMLLHSRLREVQHHLMIFELHVFALLKNFLSWKHTHTHKERVLKVTHLHCGSSWPFPGSCPSHILSCLHCLLKLTLTNICICDGWKTAGERTFKSEGLSCWPRKSYATREERLPFYYLSRWNMR